MSDTGRTPSRSTSAHYPGDGCQQPPQKFYFPPTPEYATWIKAHVAPEGCEDCQQSPCRCDEGYYEQNVRPA